MPNDRVPGISVEAPEEEESQATLGGSEAEGQDGLPENFPPEEEREPEYEFVDADSVPDEPKVDPTVEEIKRQNQEMQERLAKLGEQTDTSKLLADHFAKLNQNLNRSPEVRVTRDEDPNARRKQEEEEFFKNPIEYQRKLTQRMIEEQYAPQFTQQLNQLQLHTSKAEALTTERNKRVYDKYKSEVEQIVHNLPQKTGAYQTALAYVTQQHFDDIIEEEIANRTGQSEQKKPASSKAPQSSFSMTAGSRRPEGSHKRQVRLSAAQRNKVSQFATSRGVSFENAYEFLNNKGAL